MSTPATSAVLRDANQVPYPQYWNNVGGAFETLFGLNGTLFVAKPLDTTGAFAFNQLYSSGALEPSGLIKNAAGTFYKALVTNTATTTTYYFMIFNATSLPANGTAPKFRYLIPNSLTSLIDITPSGLFFSTGMFYAISTTPATLTVTSNNLFLVDAFGA